MTIVNVARFEVFTTTKIHVVVFWVVTPCIHVVEYQCFGGPCYVHLQGEAKMEVGWSSEKMIFYHMYTRHLNTEDHYMNH
jgi:hypothetical protein